MSTVQITPTQQQMDMGLQMAGYLEDLLQRQIERLKNYDMDGAWGLAEESKTISQQLKNSGLLELPEFNEHKQQIQGLYKELMLIIASERQEVSDKLSQIREGMRAVSSYSQNK